MAQDDPLVLSIKTKLHRLHPPSVNIDRPITIFRLPSYIRECYKNFFEPRIVSIGPYHRNREDLRCMGDEKLQFAEKFLSDNTDVPVEKYIEMLRELEPTARRCYHEEINMDKDEFVEMLFFDACFIIQLVMDWSFREDADVLYDIGWSIPLIKSDIIMLENQIPFSVLQHVFDLYASIDDTYSSSPPTNSDLTSEASDIPKASLSYLLLSFLHLGNVNLLLPEGGQSFDHLTEFYYHYHMSTQKLLFKFKPRKNSFPLKLLRLRLTKRIKIMYKRRQMILPCATELIETGITFKKAESRSIFHVSFSDGVLTIPYMTIEEATRPQLMNLIAFEQCSGQNDKPLTRYAVFMSCIMNTPRDVLILQKHGIINNKLADEKAAVMFFNQLRLISYLDDMGHLEELILNVQKYCDYRWPKYKVRLLRDYFSNPWSIMSLVAAIVILFLTTVQTVYTVLSYYQ